MDETTGRREEKGQPLVLSLVPGRMRVHLPGWDGDEPDRIEARLRALPGVEAARANPLTGNVLVRFDRRAVEAPAILAALQAQPGPGSAGPGPGRLAAPLLRVGVRGVLGHAVVDAAWFGAGFLGRSAGLSLAAWLGPLHLLSDILVWGAALASVSPPPPVRT
jgi:hypothetical protein